MRSVVVEGVDTRASRLSEIIQRLTGLPEHFLLDAAGQVEGRERIVGLRHAANLNTRSTSRPTFSANRTGTAFPNCRIVSDQEPWKT